MSGADAAHQSRPAAEQRRPDLVDLLSQDHARIRELLLALDRAGGPGAGPSTGELVDLTVAELSRQVTVERRFLVPMVRDNLADSEADRELTELAELEESVRQLYAQASATGPGIGAAELLHRLQRLVEGRERHLYPRLRAACDRERLRAEGTRARAARATAPTRPHPRAPDRPPWSRMSDQLVGAADRIGDELSGRRRSAAHPDRA